MLLPLHAALVSSRLEVDNVSYLEHDHLQAHVMEFRVQLPDDKRQRPKGLDSYTPSPHFDARSPVRPNRGSTALGNAVALSYGWSWVNLVI